MRGVAQGAPNCAHCNCAPITYAIPHPIVAGEKWHFAHCDHCKREFNGLGTWIKRAGYCQGCRCETWRHIAHPMHEHPILLWPLPTTIVCLIATPEGPGAHTYQDYCPGCCPEFGHPAPAPWEQDGEPMPTGACVGHERVHETYAHKFSDQFGDFLAVWLGEVGFDDEARTRLLAQWRADRHPVNGHAVSDHSDHPDHQH